MNFKKIQKDAVDMTVTGTGMGAMAGIDNSGAVGKISKAMPIVGGVMAGKIAIDATKELLPKKKII